MRGRLIDKSPESLLIDVGGTGYEVTAPVGLVTELKTGDEVSLYIHTHVREDLIQLFGFATEKEKRVFRILLGITGVGPKLALNILSGSRVDEFLSAVDSEDIGMLTRLPGVGKKTAERIVFELREKLPRHTSDKDRNYTDTLSALVNLGYKRADAMKALDMVYKEGHSSIEALLRETLKVLNK